MIKRTEIEKDFNNSMPSRKDELLVFEREKLLLETQLDILEMLEKLSAALRKVVRG